MYLCVCVYYRYMISLSSRSKLDESTKERSLSLSTMLYEDSVRIPNTHTVCMVLVVAALIIVLEFALS